MAQKLFIALLIVLVILRIKSNPTLIDGQKLEINGVVANDPKHSQFKTYFKIGSINVSTKKEIGIEYGQMVKVSGVYSDGFLTADNIVIVGKQVSLAKVRSKLIQGIRLSLHEPHASLVSGIFLGTRPSVESFDERLKEVGLSHVVVASGGNIALVLAFVNYIFAGRVRRKYLIIFLCISVFAYILLSGFGPPIVRAGVMVGLVLLAQIFGKPNTTLRVLFLAIVFCLIVFPQWITDLSFLLSISATWGLIYLSPIISKKIIILPEFIRLAVSTTVSAQIATAPIIILYFNNFQPLSVVYNLLVVWVTPFIFMVGLLGSLIYFVSPTISTFTYYLALPFTSWFNFVIGI